MTFLSAWQKFEDFISPRKQPIRAAAISQTSHPTPKKAAGRPSSSNGKREPILITTKDAISKPRRNMLDIVTKAAGSNWVFVAMMAIMLVWVIFGFVDGTTDTWQIVMQNASSIQVYLTDILLLRQASNASNSLLTTLAELQSRNQTFERLLRRLPSCQWMETHKNLAQKLFKDDKPVGSNADDILLTSGSGDISKARYMWNNTCKTVAKGLGSIWAYILYWIGIFFWVGMGPLFQFSDTWQLYVNTATAVALTFTSIFLQNIQQQQENNLEQCLEYALRVDSEVEWRLREITNDYQTNPIFEIPAPTISWIDRSIDIFADIMGSGVGLLITLIVTIVWIAVGPILEFNDNWWLIIGTFTGLVGFIDGFVLRNVYYRDEKVAEVQFEKIAESNDRLLDLLNIPSPYQSITKARNFSTRASAAAGEFCALSSVSIASVGVVFALLATASIMKWSETGQLLCNTPTMIIEGFLLLILIQAHNIANAARGADFQSLLKHRLLLNHYVCELSENSNRSSSPYSHNPDEKSVDNTDFYPTDENDNDIKISVHQIEDCV
ncbi:putative low affinity iron protein [Botrytis fragariae]|uniref:Putative low affinity iron protein n=1 Tax=Botrytis fragariae TaxID=1964551 RepID=A0A8H6EJA2_9HELO|nr:putative low affinity iron protein [Botrytis fragariae]KAF5874321.1 putative low affinity iron protein [Botrytis fragariae]